MEFTPTVGAASGKARPSLRAGRIKRRKTKKRTDRFVGHAFLRHCFLPLVSDAYQELDNQREIEKGFFLSAKHLCSLYGFGEMPTSTMPYPQNLAKGVDWLTAKLKATDSGLDLRLLQDERFPARLASLKTFSTGSTLFYLPIEPMLRMVKNTKTKGVGELLLSVYAYLFQIVRIAHFSQDYAYLGSIYGMLEDWWVNDEGYAEDEQERLAHVDFFSALWERGKISLMLMGGDEPLADFGHRVKSFVPSTKAQGNFHKTAEAFFELYTDYPKRSVGDNIFEPFGGDSEDYTIRTEQYLHFFWDFGQLVHDQFMECINAELNECSLMDEPVTLQYFDTPQKAVSHDQDFETRLFALLHELTDNVIDLNDE